MDRLKKSNTGEAENRSQMSTKESHSGVHGQEIVAVDARFVKAATGHPAMLHV
jgi:hypothetical protein